MCFVRHPQSMGRKVTLVFTIHRPMKTRHKINCLKYPDNISVRVTPPCHVLSSPTHPSSGTPDSKRIDEKAIFTRVNTIETLSTPIFVELKLEFVVNGMKLCKVVRRARPRLFIAQLCSRYVVCSLALHLIPLSACVD